MLSAYGTDKGCLTGFPTITDVVPEGVVWIDMVEPTFDEEKVVEASLKIDIPTREELPKSKPQAASIRKTARPS